MLIDVYSGAHCWVLAPQHTKPPRPRTGTLTYEGTVHLDLLDVTAGSANAKIEFALIPEDLGRKLLHRSLSHCCPDTMH